MTKFIITAIIGLAAIMLFKREKQVETGYQAFLLEYDLPDTEDNQVYYLDVFTETDEYFDLLEKYSLL